MNKMLLAATAIAASLAAMPVQAAITWTDWTQSSTVGATTTVTGTAGAVGVTFVGNNVGFVQTSGGTDYWNTSAASTWDSTIAPPPGSDIIALSGAGTKTITFSNAVTTAYLALNSWNNQSFSSTSAFTFAGLVNGCGYWGCGTPLNVTATSFTSPGELHGIIKFAGPITSITFTDGTDEFWHGIQVGYENANGAVPEPATWAMMIGGFGAIGGAMRLRRRRETFARAVA